MTKHLLVALVAIAALAFGIGEVNAQTCATINVSTAKYMLSFQSGPLKCAAAIISTKFAVTSAICAVANVTTMKLYAGRNDYQSATATAYLVSAKILQIVDPNTFDNDIALLKMATPFVFTTSIGSIALPSQGLATAIGASASVTGWSTTCGSPAAALQKIILPVGSCALYGVYSTAKKLCVTLPSTAVQPCQGDSGGPMVVGGKLTGIRSFPTGYCATAGKPLMYTKVSLFRNWIDASMLVMG